MSARATLATRAAAAAGIVFAVHEYSHDPGAASYGLEAAERLELDLKSLAAAASVKKAAMADPRAAERRTG